GLVAASRFAVYDELDTRKGLQARHGVPARLVGHDCGQPHLLGAGEPRDELQHVDLRSGSRAGEDPRVDRDARAIQRTAVRVDGADDRWARLVIRAARRAGIEDQYVVGEYVRKAPGDTLRPEGLTRAGANEL